MVLVIISEFMQDEIYLSEEINYYHDIEKVVFFSVKGHKFSNSPLEMKNGIVCGERDVFYRGALDRLLYLARGAFSKDGIKELASLIKNHKLSTETLKSFFLFSAKSELLYSHMKRALAKHIDNNREKVVFYSYRFGIGVKASIKLKSFYPNASVIARCHGQDIFEFRNKWNYLPYRKCLYEGIDRLYCISDDGKEYIETNYPACSSKIKVSKLGTSDIGYNANNSNAPFVVVSCSRVVPIKRLELLISALKCMTENVTWIHYGEGDPEYQKEIDHLCESLPPNIKVCFMGFIDNAYLHRDYSKNQFSVFVNVSSSEGLPVSIMEACSAGLPIIATDVGGTSEIVKDGKNGFLLDKDFRVNELAALLCRLAGMTESDYRKMSKNSREIWESSYSSKANYMSFIHDIVTEND